METLAWLENTGLSIWAREAIWAFPILLVLHAIGMAFLVGTSIAINLRLLGLIPNAPLHYFSQLYPLIIIAFVISLISGLLLLLSYPAKGLTNPVFFMKMLLIVGAMILTLRQQSFLRQSNSVVTKSIKVTAACILFLWLASIVSGRFLAYTHTWLLVS